MTDQVLHQLEVPPDATENGGHEVLRCFIVDGALSVALRRSFEDAGTWGALLADLARQAARIYALETDTTEDDALSDIREMFTAAMEREPGAGSPSTRN